MVLDASAAVELLLNTPAGQAVARRVQDESTDLDVPHLIDVEITQALRRFASNGDISPARGTVALEHWRQLSAERHPHEPFLARIWQLRDNFSAYDAVYVALAEVLDTELVTADARLARAPGSHVVVELVSAVP